MSNSANLIGYVKATFLDGVQIVFLVFDALGAAMFFFPQVGSFFQVNVASARIIGVGIVLLSFILANLRLYYRLVGQNAQLAEQLHQIEASDAVISIDQIRQAQLFRSSEFMNRKRPIFKVVQIWFRNTVDVPTGRSIPAQVQARIEYWSQSGDELLLAVHGQWAVSTAPDHVGFSETVDSIAIPPGHIAAKLNVALKHHDDADSYAYSKENLGRDPDGRDPAHRLRSGDYKVRVQLVGAGSGREFWFVLKNRSTGGEMELEELGAGFAVKVSTRLRRSLELMNAFPRDKKLHTARVADLLDIPKVRQLQLYFDGKDEAPLAFLDQYSSFFGINPDWLKNGDYNPFTPTDRWRNKPLDYLERILEIAPSEVSFVLDQASFHICIILHMSEHKSILLPSKWTVIAWRGDGGFGDIISLHRLMKELIGSGISDPRAFHGLSSSCVIEHSIFRELMRGLLYPGGFSINVRRHSLWHLDFMDIYHRRYSADHYEKEYCADFVQAQLQVRRHAPDLYTHDR